MRRICSRERSTARPETHRGVIALGFRLGQWVAFLAPVLGLLVFRLFPFKPAVTLYVVIVGLGIVLLKVIELTRLSCESEEIVRRKVHEDYSH